MRGGAPPAEEPRLDGKPLGRHTVKALRAACEARGVATTARGKALLKAELVAALAAALAAGGGGGGEPEPQQQPEAAKPAEAEGDPGPARKRAKAAHPNGAAPPPPPPPPPAGKVATPPAAGAGAGGGRVGSTSKSKRVVEGKDCPELGTIVRMLLDFDFEKCCSVTLSPDHVYGCLVCGKYYQGRGQVRTASSPSRRHPLPSRGCRRLTTATAAATGAPRAGHARLHARAGGGARDVDQLGDGEGVLAAGGARGGVPEPGGHPGE